jgi:hypothetical protein
VLCEAPDAEALPCSVVSSLNIQQHSSTQTLIVSTSAHVSSLLEDLRQAPPSQALLTTGVDTIDTTTEPSPVVPVVNRNSRHPVPRAHTRRLLLLQSRWIGKRIEIFQRQVCSGWDLMFRTYNIRPSGWPSFLYAWDGDVASLRRLFETGYASINDRTADGRTLLHVHSDHVSRNGESSLIIPTVCGVESSWTDDRIPQRRRCRSG